MIMNVAVRCAKHSPIFGHIASSHTECRRCSRSIDAMPATVSLIIGLARSHAGFVSAPPGSGGTTFTGMRASLSRLLKPCCPSAVTLSWVDICGAAAIVRLRRSR
ncbi:hypothetical protein CBA19CS91_26735 [Paraburkholderia hospita]|nr:hypothetical protein CBA19CS91_26735 [Paraburkholderia hospita]